MAPKAAPMMTATARSRTLPFITNALNSFNMFVSVSLFLFCCGSLCLSRSCPGVFPPLRIPGHGGIAELAGTRTHDRWKLIRLARPSPGFPPAA